MQLYRIEHKKNGQGPFRNKLTAGSDYFPPGPNTDGIFGTYDDYWDAIRKGVAEQYFYAFKDVDQLKSWFKEDSVRRFCKREHVLVKFEVPEEKVLFGGAQVAFKPKDVASKKYWVPLKEVYHVAA